MSSIGRRSCEIMKEKKPPLSHEVMCFQMLDFGTSNSKSEVSKLNNITSEGAVSHSVLFHQPLPILVTE